MARIAKRIVLLGTVVGVPAIALTFCVGNLAYYSEKFAEAPAEAYPVGGPTELPVIILPEHQTEPNTCGFHSLSAVYRAYGLDSEALRLRFRLGVDKPLNTLVPDSTGAIHPDMVRVVEQDGFRAAILRPSASDTMDRSRAHMIGGHPIVTLIRAQSGGLHWVVASNYSAVDGTVRVCDSLFETPYRRPAEQFLTVDALSLILVRPGE